MVGSDDLRLMVWTPVLGILKVMFCCPEIRLEQLMASRREPAPASLVLTTRVLHPLPCTVTVRLNSEVLPAASVAVAMISSPALTEAVVMGIDLLAPASAERYVS